MSRNNQVTPRLCTNLMSLMLQSRCLAVVVCLITVVIATAVVAQIASPLYQNEKTTLLVRTAEGAEATLHVVSVVEPDDMRRGLMHIRHLPLDQGMIFLHTSDRKLSMWMKNTYIPLDIWFVSVDGTVEQVVRNTEPLSLDTINSVGTVRAVVEVNAGVSDLIGVEPGTVLHHPNFRRIEKSTRNIDSD